MYMYVYYRYMYMYMQALSEVVGAACIMFFAYIYVKALLRLY